MSAARQSLDRVWQFGRHIPPRKMVRRVVLNLQRRLQDMRAPINLPDANVRLRDTLPAPIFPARATSAVRREGTGLIFCFLGRDVGFENGQIDWGAPGPDPAHQLWRMNLHYMEYLEAVDDALFAELVHGWLDANEPIGPGAWRDAWNAYVLSIRVVVWLQQMGVRPGLDKNLRSRMADSISRQIRYLTRYLETDIGGNHLIKNIKALLWAGAAFEGSEAAHWAAMGGQLLRQELPVQILPDGVHYERSPSYHAQVFSDLLECRSVLLHNREDLDSVLPKMAQAIVDLAHPDGFCAQFNDAGLNMAYAPEICMAAYQEQGFDRPEPRPRFAFSDAGYFGVQDGPMKLIIDCGVLAPDDLPAHGHGDILSFELSIGKQRIVVDQGVFEYIPGPKRDMSRSASRHNTLSLKCADQADFFGAFRIGRRARTIRANWDTHPDYVALDGAHDGYAAAPGKPRHRRTFIAKPDSILINDELQATTPQDATISFLLHPDVSAKADKKDAIRLTWPGEAGSQPLEILMQTTARLNIEPAVWWPDMGMECSTERLVANLSKGQSKMQTEIFLNTKSVMIPDPEHREPKTNPHQHTPS